MKFGKFLQERSKLEWRLYYVDYSYLKQLIKEMKQQISSGTQTKKEVEHKFTKAIDLEINKVNDVFLMVTRVLKCGSCNITKKKNVEFCYVSLNSNAFEKYFTTKNFF